MAALLLAFVALVANSHPLAGTLRDDNEPIAKLLQQLQAEVNQMDSESHDQMFAAFQDVSQFLQPKLNSTSIPTLTDIPDLNPLQNFFVGFLAGFFDMTPPSLEAVYKGCKAAPKAFIAAVHEAEQAWAKQNKTAVLNGLLKAALDAYNAVYSCCQYIPYADDFCYSIQDFDHAYRNCTAAPKEFMNAVQEAEDALKNPSSTALLNGLFSAVVDGYKAIYSCGQNIPYVDDFLHPLSYYEKAYTSCKAAPANFMTAVQEAKEAVNNQNKTAMAIGLYIAALDSYEAVYSCCQYIPYLDDYCDPPEDLVIDIIAGVVKAIWDVQSDAFKAWELLGLDVYAWYEEIKLIWNSGDISYYNLGELLGGILNQ